MRAIQPRCRANLSLHWVIAVDDFEVREIKKFAKFRKTERLFGKFSLPTGLVENQLKQGIPLSRRKGNFAEKSRGFLHFWSRQGYLGVPTCQFRHEGEGGAGGGVPPRAAQTRHGSEP